VEMAARCRNSRICYEQEWWWSGRRGAIFGIDVQCGGESRDLAAFGRQFGGSAARLTTKSRMRNVSVSEVLLGIVWEVGVLGGYHGVFSL